MPDTPGTLAEVAGIIARHRGNILEVVHDRSDLAAPAWHARLQVTVEVPSRQEAEAILGELEGKGYRFRVKK